MLTLKPSRFKFMISTVYLELFYNDSSSDSCNTKIKVEAVPLSSVDKQNYVTIEIGFSFVAEAKCVTLNFYESHYNDFSILEETLSENSSESEYKKSHHPDSGFYEVVDSEYLQQNIKRYDPKGFLNLRHFIVTGYDGYVELLASTYCVNEIDIR